MPLQLPMMGWGAGGELTKSWPTFEQLCVQNLALATSYCFSPTKIRKETAHKHKQNFPVTARVGRGLPTGWPGVSRPMARGQRFMRCVRSPRNITIFVRVPGREDRVPGREDRWPRWPRNCLCSEDPEGKNAKGKNFWKLRGRKKCLRKIFQKISQKIEDITFIGFYSISGYLRNLRGRLLSSEKFSEVFTLWVFTLKPFSVCAKPCPSFPWCFCFLGVFLHGHFLGLLECFRLVLQAF